MHIKLEDFDNSRVHSTNMMQSKAEQRRSNKPIMEKKRRARINHCLNELKTLILDAMKKDPARHSKLEKADILEMTVKHLQTIQRQQLAIAVATDPTVLRKFKNGFSECAEEVTRYVGHLQGVESGVQQRLNSHLTQCVMGLDQIGPVGSYPVPSITINAMPLTVADSSSSSSLLEDINNNGARARGLQLIPSRLSTGELALLVPNSAKLPFLPSMTISTQPVFPSQQALPPPPQADIISQSHQHTSAFVTVNPSRSPSHRQYNPTPSSPLVSPASSTSSYATDEIHHLQPPTPKKQYTGAFKPATRPTQSRSMDPTFDQALVSSSKSNEQPLSVITNQSERYKLAQQTPDSSQFAEENARPSSSRKRLYSTEYFHHGLLRVATPAVAAAAQFSSAGGGSAKVQKTSERSVDARTDNDEKASTSTANTSNQPSESGSSDMWRPW